MKMPSTPEVRNELIAQLRNAVRTQIEFWDFTAAVAEIIDVEHDYVLQFCQNAAIYADTGMELEGKDLQELLDWLGAMVARSF
jgi:hypothetical protein